MTGTKLGFLNAASPPRVSTNLARNPSRALHDAIAAQVGAVAVAICRNSGRARSAHLIIDVSFLVALDHRVHLIDGGHNRTLALGWSEARMAAYDGTILGDPESACARWSVLPPGRPGPVPMLNTRDNSATEALTLRLCFETKTPGRAQALADDLARHVAVWNPDAASLRDTMERIRALIFESWLPKKRAAAAHYRSACIYGGWHHDLHGPANPLWEAPGDGGMDVILGHGDSAFVLAQHCTELWYATLNTPPKGQLDRRVCAGADDLAASTDAADDFVPADRFMALWFGSGSAGTVE